jgi:hypothetical protein
MLSALCAVLYGCARTPLAPLGQDHPASPQAAEAAVPVLADIPADPDAEAPQPSAAAADPGHGGHAGHAAPAAEAAASYVCPMHPEVVSDAPGACPKCGMALVATEAAPPAPAGQDADSGPAGSDARTAPAGHDWPAAPAAAEAAASYVCPMHPEVVSDAPGACPKCGMALAPQEAQP